jgi:hypothetical protein
LISTVLTLGIPEEIVGLPQRVMATPFGMALRPMFDQMQRQMSSVQGSHGIGAHSDASATLPVNATNASSVTQPATTNPQPTHSGILSTNSGYLVLRFYIFNSLLYLCFEYNYLIYHVGALILIRSCLFKRFTRKRHTYLQLEMRNRFLQN